MKRKCKEREKGDREIYKEAYVMRKKQSWPEIQKDQDLLWTMVVIEFLHRGQWYIADNKTSPGT